MAVLAVAVAVAACGNLPRPFSPENKTYAAVDALLPGDGGGVVVDGLLCPGAGPAMIEALIRLDIPATDGAGNRGSLRLVCDGTGWLLAGADGVGIGSIPVTMPEAVAQNVLALLNRDRLRRPAVPRPALVVASVTGAPGDGAVALTRAMALALTGRGFALIPEPDATALMVVGRVVVGSPDGGLQRVEIFWELRSADGDSLGTVSQENSIDAGALDGAWGAIAPAVADAGADGLIELIDRIIAP